LPKATHYFTAKLDISIKRGRWRITEMAREVAVLDCQDATRFQAPHHPGQRGARLLQMTQQKSGVDKVKGAEATRWIARIRNAIINVHNILRRGLSSDNFELGYARNSPQLSNESE
jgi:hypothetical protein